MRPLLWLLLVVSVLANVYVGTFSDLTGGLRAAGSVGTGAVVLGSAVGLWLTRRREEARG
ncbi:hypothetical protein AB0G79_32395 [Streptomyces sp. NPDC020807]|uniref:hypothetical protein n=1 Tax=unclassified Streptomyces TaxID=2593676 RepID=UPI0034065C37